MPPACFTTVFTIIKGPNTWPWQSKRRTVTLEPSLSHCLVMESHATKRSTTQLAWQDVLGTRLTQEDEVIADPSSLDENRAYYFEFVALPAKHPTADKPSRRVLHKWLCSFPQNALKEIQELLKWINFLADPRSTEDVARAHSFDDLVLVERPPRRFLVVINPISGAGKGMKVYQKKVAPAFAYAHIITDIQLTERAKHGVDIAKQVDPSKYDAIVTVGGDGSLRETLQGLMARPDWQEAIRMPLGVIPSGSGIGLFAAKMHAARELFVPVSAAFVLAKGVPHPLDITVVRNPFGETMYSFLSTTWALFADVDLGSEHLRFLGLLRFTITAVNRIVFIHRAYQGTIWYLEDDETRGYQPQPYDFERSTDRPGLDLVDAVEEGALAADGSGGRWRKIESSFHMMAVMSISHAATDVHMAPGARFNDGYCYLIMLNAMHSRKDLIKMVLTAERGEHVNVKSAEFIKTRAFKIVPAEADERISVDGQSNRLLPVISLHQSLEDCHFTKTAVATDDDNRIILVQRYPHGDLRRVIRSRASSHFGLDVGKLEDGGDVLGVYPLALACTTDRIDNHEEFARGSLDRMDVVEGRGLFDDIARTRIREVVDPREENFHLVPSTG